MSKLLRLVWMLLTVVLGTAAEEKRDLLVNYIPSSLLKTNNAQVCSLPEPSLRILPQAAPLRGREARWNHFETEFGLQDKQPNLIEEAVYQMHRMMFVFKDFLEHGLNFDYELNNILRATPSNTTPLPGQPVPSLAAWCAVEIVHPSGVAHRP